jgi:hypothetical protein
MKRCVKKVDGKTGDISYPLISVSREFAHACRDSLRSAYPENTYTVVRRVTRREKLKRKLLADSATFDAKAGFVGQSPERWWNAGYARALRDVAGQL